MICVVDFQVPMQSVHGPVSITEESFVDGVDELNLQND